MFKDEIRSEINRIHRAKIPGGTEFEFDLINKEISPKNIKNKVGIKVNGNWENTANIYWLGHDMMWTIYALMSGGGKRNILWGLNQSLHHLESINIAEGKLGEPLIRLINKIEKLVESDLNDEKRLEFTKDTNSLLNEYGIYMAVNQPDFEAAPGESTQ